MRLNNYNKFHTQKSVITGTTTTTNYSYNAANEITNVNGIPQYTHDYNGSITGAYGYTFTYNAEVVKAKPADLTKALKIVNIKYAMKFNQQRDRVGHVF